MVPHQAARGFALVRSDPLIPAFGLPFHAYHVDELHPLPPGGRLLDTNAWDGVFKLAPTQPLKEGQLDYAGVSRPGGGTDLGRCWAAGAHRPRCMAAPAALPPAASVLHAAPSP